MIAKQLLTAIAFLDRRIEVTLESPTAERLEIEALFFMLKPERVGGTCPHHR